jgi:CDP-glucose 4,6-dehydratase
MTKAPPQRPAIFGNAYAGKKVLLTGHTGFKGAWLGEWLVSLGAKVTGFSIDCEEPSLFRDLHLSDRLQDLRGDVRDLSKMRELVTKLKPDFVFHLAAQPLVRESYRDPVETFTTNVDGSMNVMEAVRLAGHSCIVVMVTTDKVYENREKDYAYREGDPLGGHDPYSSSKAAAEIIIESYRKSFFAVEQPLRVALASARAGNVIGGGDWATDRILPDAIRALSKGQNIGVRNKNATRPWQHVLDPLSGYLTLGAALARSLGKSGPADFCTAFNFGPNSESNRPVSDVVDEIVRHWPGKWEDRSESNAPHEAGLLNLDIAKASQALAWQPVWNFSEAIKHTIAWYRETTEGGDAVTITRRQLGQFEEAAAAKNLSWAIS